MSKIRYAIAAAASAAALVASGGTALADGVTPNVDQAADPGEVIHVTKTVSTPPIPPKPDIVLLVDKTSSMGGELTNVKANFSSIVSQVQGIQPDAQFAVAAYCDFDDTAPAFELFSDLTGDATALTTAINNVNLCNGGDTPEAQLNALWEIGDGGDAVTFRPDSSRIVVWYGDNPGHDPSGGHTEADATQSLMDVDAKVLAISTGAANNLDGTSQATRITDATGGDLLSGVAAGDVSDAILAGLQNLDVTVAGSPSCDPGLSVVLSPASQTVQSGTDAVFDETITVAPDATQGDHPAVHRSVHAERCGRGSGVHPDGQHRRQRRDAAVGRLPAGTQPCRTRAERGQRGRLLPDGRQRQRRRLGPGLHQGPRLRHGLRAVRVRDDVQADPGARRAGQGEGLHRRRHVEVHVPG